MGGQAASPITVMAVLRDMISGKNPEQTYQEMYQKYPEFREYTNSISGMTPEQAFHSKGYDFGSTMGQIMNYVNQMRGM